MSRITTVNKKQVHIIKNEVWSQHLINRDQHLNNARDTKMPLIIKSAKSGRCLTAKKIGDI